MICLFGFDFWILSLRSATPLVYSITFIWVNLTVNSMSKIVGLFQSRYEKCSQISSSIEWQLCLCFAKEGLLRGEGNPNGNIHKKVIFEITHSNIWNNPFYVMILIPSKTLHNRHKTFIQVVFWKVLRILTLLRKETKNKKFNFTKKHLHKVMKIRQCVKAWYGILWVLREV